MQDLTESQKIDLIEKLKTDDDFRADFVADPADVLQTHYQVTLASSELPTGVIELPSKQEFEDNFNEHIDKANDSMACADKFKFDLN